MFKDPAYNMIIDEKTAKYVSETEWERKSLYTLEPTRASSMPAKRMKSSAIPAAIIQTDTATESPTSMVAF